MNAPVPVTRLLVAANVLVFLWEIATIGPGAFSGNATGLQYVNDGALMPSAVTEYHQYWRIVTGAFLHVSIIHIGFNMFALWIFGRFIESVTGSWRMLVIYAISLVVSGISVVLFSAPDVPTLGASGAIFGLIGALFAIGFKLGRHGMELIRANLPMLILNLLFTFFFPGISWQAHVGGLIAGFIVTYLIYFPPRRVSPYAYDRQTGSELDTEYQAP